MAELITAVTDALLKRQEVERLTGLGRSACGLSDRRLTCLSTSTAVFHCWSNATVFLAIGQVPGTESHRRAKEEMWVRARSDDRDIAVGFPYHFRTMLFWGCCIALSA